MSAPRLDRRYCRAPACACHATELTETCKACGCRVIPPKDTPQWVGHVTFRNARYPGAPVQIKLEGHNITTVVGKAVRLAKKKLKPRTRVDQVCVNLTRVRGDAS